jgi:hypothetical protein
MKAPVEHGPTRPGSEDGPTRPPAFLKIFGLERSGTNYLQWLLAANFRGARLLVDETGWKHGPVPESIDWSGKDWHDPRWPPEKALPFVRRRLEALGARGIAAIDRAFGSRRFLYVFLVKDPYAWYLSYARFRGKALRASIPEGIDLWCLRNRHYQRFCQSHRDRSLLVTYEDLLLDAESTLAPLRSFGLCRRSRPWREPARRLTPRCALSKRAFDRELYLRRSYLQRFAPSSLAAICRRLPDDLLRDLGYGGEEAASLPSARGPPETGRRQSEESR